MRDPRRDDLVPMTAIVAGTVVGIAVTIASLLLSGDDSSKLLWGWTPNVDVVGTPEVAASATEPSWLDPRGPERGPTEVEWEVIRTYEAIESMTGTEPPRRVVDQTLERLRIHALEHTDNPYIQELYLRALRVAEYHAAEAGDPVRAFQLAARLDRHAAEVGRYEGAALERMRMLVQLVQRSCLETGEHAGELRRVAEQHPESEAIAEALVQGLEIAYGECALSR